MITAALTLLDFADMHLSNSQAAYEQTQCPAFYMPDTLPSLRVAIAQPAMLLIDLPSPLYRMNAAEREAMDRAFWRSVTIVDEGSEG